jgi:DNA-binding NtrC family response regulator
MPGMDRMQLLEELKKSASARGHHGHGIRHIKSAEAIEERYDYLPKPFTPDEVRVIIQRATEDPAGVGKRRPAPRPQPQVTFQNIIGNSPASRFRPDSQSGRHGQQHSSP